MQYFWINLGFTLFIILVLLIGLISCIKEMFEKKLKDFILIIVTLAALILIIVIKDTLPYFQDMNYILTKNFLVSTCTVEKIGLSSKLGNDFLANGKSFYCGSTDFKIKKGQRYILTYTPNKRFVIKLEPAK
ncbi:hypothetical protein CPAST_c26020 [Clostridium pasteurianum DSM 525 = ATCC 6013]|uniref:Uncharacterized protein n=1 Tax=Clostridium pasteurianum DSM 525 = ATCC 6013 TaxID=1262449 RepID=A0A0H3JAL5_CLOPA|nr:hypothetical protein [Clostridium pasteurianum]AJA48670.1 hypothetical protein CPAST_c26020 [Clostridium pasteurianum DSM 525 = ATCC 6013]AJA52658.1 hypothetical protein CLPA_c26020 [Clostridium pasteurianum DSM 525 = ATCC 6013]AOZ75898.1 hypothetical protein AQ983_12650 [Clostridium pasteurianum DSM 525 = ATCC 6013]AOZ79694.1 hypothetical protein AQ984_12645 [Clostridium pasteurianum]ELP59970.1 hypothetical protein F502_05022 [Clostridium pasteurianum DSM 525 = ATCC 6013]